MYTHPVPKGCPFETRIASTSPNLLHEIYIVRADSGQQ